MSKQAAHVSNHGVSNKGGNIPPRPITFAFVDASNPIDVPSPKKTILVVERFQLMREGLATILRLGWPNFDIHFAEDSLQLNGELDCEPTLILMRASDDHASPALPETLHDKFSRIPVLLISDRDDPYRALSALRSGFAGYFPSTLSADMLMAAISLILAGGKFCPSCLSRCCHPDANARSAGSVFVPDS